MYKLIYITTTDGKEAKRIAEVLVEERLAACVNIFPIKSIYRWERKIQREGEVALIVKTKDELVDKVIKRAKELHSYDIPCIISLSIEKGYPKFLKWIDKETK
ncbi:divalent-cation tolerance protein CutA [Patescibacteria group bacterium]|nr:divalent-cation tolerance protein CutA [Patescibacteria group bacterium]